MGHVSITRAWEETRHRIGRDGKLLVSIALAMFVLPGTVSALFQPAAPQGQMPQPGWWMLLALVTLLIGVVGQLAIFRLSIHGGSVGESIRHGLHRLLPFLGATLLVAIPLSLIAILVIGASGGDPQQPRPIVGLVLLMLIPIVLFVAVRLLMMAPVASSEALGPVGILKRSWALTRGNWWRLFGFLVLFVVAATIIGLAVGAVVGSAVTILAGPVEPMSVGALALALVSQTLGAAFTLLLVVMLARIYVQLSAGVADVNASVPSSGT